MSDLVLQRRFFAEEIATLCDLKTPALIEALATVPREKFLPPGPWTIRAEGDYLSSAPRRTPDDDPRHINHNVAVAIDLDRQLFNGGPSLLAVCIDRLDLRPGHRVLHLGCGLGYYSALIAECVGSSGQVVALEIDETLAAAATRNLAAFAQVRVLCGDGMIGDDEPFDAIMINAGVTHPQDTWLDSLRPLGGRMILPLTATMPAMGSIGKGPLLLLTKRETDFDLQMLTMVAIYSAIGIRDSRLNEQIGKSMMRGRHFGLRRLRRDEHDESSGCWLHTPRFCLSG